MAGPQAWLAHMTSRALWHMRGRVGTHPSAKTDERVDAAGLDKTGLVKLLAHHCGFDRYLEIATAQTGNYYRSMGNSGLQTRRLLYRCKWYQSDGMRIDYRSADNDIVGSLARLGRDGYRPQICLVDGYHDYATARRDIAAAVELVPVGGIVVVHDCLPPTLDLAAPAWSSGNWSGETYRAFIDFVWTTSDLGFFCVDCDYGCGVIVKGAPASASLAALVGTRYGEQSSPAYAAWQGAGGDHEKMFACLQEHKVELLNLISVDRLNLSMRCA